MWSTGDSILELFALDAQVMFPQWGIANGREEIGKMFGDLRDLLYERERERVLQPCRISLLRPPRSSRA